MSDVENTGAPLPSEPVEVAPDAAEVSEPIEVTPEAPTVSVVEDEDDEFPEGDPNEGSNGGTF